MNLPKLAKFLHVMRNCLTSTVAAVVLTIINTVLGGVVILTQAQLSIGCTNII